MIESLSFKAPLCRKIDHDVGYGLNNPSCRDAKRTKTNDTETLGGCIVKGILSEGWERMHLEEYTISRGVRVRDILFANLLDTPDAKEFLVSRCES